MRKRILSVVTALGISSGLICYAPQETSAVFYVDDFSYSSDCFYDPEIYTEPVDYDLYSRFLKYDLCIADYDTLTDEEKELCKFVFEHERSANQTIRCERSRRILAGDDVGERLTVSDIEGKRCIIDPANGIRGIVYNYAYCVPDIIHLDIDNLGLNEYWLNSDGDKKIIFNSYMGSDSFGYVEFLNTLPEEVSTSGNYYQTEDGKYLYCIDFPVNENLNPDNQISYNGIDYVVLPDGTLAATEIDESSNPDIMKGIVAIPDEVEGRKVTMLLKRFSNFEVTKVVLPGNLKTIADYAFTDCLSLTEIEINCPDAEIGNMAFSNTGLTKVTANVKKIDENAFANCTELENVVLEGVEKIDANAFTGCTSLSEIKFSTALKTIGQGAFSETSIDPINIPPTVEILGSLPERHGNLFENPANDPLTDEPVCVFDSDCTINGWYGTEAHSYAIENNLKFNPMDELFYGDANGDNEIGISDAVAIQNYLLNEGDVGYEADLNKDGRIDSFDMVAMRKMLIEN